MFKVQVVDRLLTFQNGLNEAVTKSQTIEQFKTILDQLTTGLRQDFGLGQLPDIPEAVAQIDTSINVQNAEGEIHMKFVLTSAHLCAEIGALQKDIQQGLEDLRSSFAYAELAAQ